MNINKLPKVSVIVPVYNVEKWVARCIESILKQTFNNFEILLVNDGSTDNSLKICNEYQKVDSRINIINKKNGGLSDARNTGIKNAKGKYLIFIDSDDYVEKDYIEYLLNAVELQNADVAACEFNLVKESGSFIKKETFNIPGNLKNLTGIEFLNYKYKPYGATCVVAWNKIYSRYLFDHISFKKGQYFEDDAILVPLFWNVAKVALVRKSLYNYVQREGSIMSTPLTQKKLQDRNNLYLNRIKFFKKKRNKRLYILAINECKDNIIASCKEKEVLSSINLRKYYQNLYRQLIHMYLGGNIKQTLKDILCFINVRFFIDIDNLFNGKN